MPRQDQAKTLLRQPGLHFTGAPFFSGSSTALVYGALMGPRGAIPNGARRALALTKATELFRLCVRHGPLLVAVHTRPEVVWQRVAAEWDACAPIDPDDLEALVLTYVRARRNFYGTQNKDPSPGSVELCRLIDEFTKDCYEPYVARLREDTEGEIQPDMVLSFRS